MQEFEILEHAADVGFRARGATKADMFIAAAIALQSVAVDLDQVEPRLPYPIAASGEDDASLLVNWLSEVLYYLDGQRVALQRFSIEEIDSGGIRGQGWGEPRDPERHPPRLVVKGVTYHQLSITKDALGWRAEVYLDV